MELKFSNRVKEVITYSREEALRLGHEYIGVEHFLLGIIREGEGLAVQVIKQLNADPQKIRLELEKTLHPTTPSKNLNVSNLPLVKQAEKVLKITYLESKLFKSQLIGTEHLLLSILKDEDNIATLTLHNFGISYETVKQELENMIPSKDFDIKAQYGEADDDDAISGGGDSSGGTPPKKSGGDSKSTTPVLDNFGRDLTRMAEEDRLDPIVGRQSEIERVSQILSRRKKNNPI